MWISDIETKVLAKLKANGEVLKKKFPKIVFTNENIIITIMYIYNYGV